MSFEGKCGIVTGAGSGIGRSTAEKLAKLGAKLLLVDYNAEALQETVELIKPKNRELYGFQANIADVSQVRGYVEKAIQLFGKIDFFTIMQVYYKSLLIYTKLKMMNLNESSM